MSKGEWKGLVKRAIHTYAEEDMKKEASKRNLPGPEAMCRPRAYVLKGGGAAKHGINYRWGLFIKDHPVHGQQVVERESKAQLTIIGTRVDSIESECNVCHLKHHPRLALNRGTK